MLTRWQVDGVNNLGAVGLGAGQSTSTAGRNGVGKSNLFYAIALLRDLAALPLVNAATRVGGPGGRRAAIHQRFGSYGQAACLTF